MRVAPSFECDSALRTLAEVPYQIDAAEAAVHDLTRVTVDHSISTEYGHTGLAIRDPTDDCRPSEPKFRKLATAWIEAERSLCSGLTRT